MFPKTEQQLCIIHQIRNSTKYVSYNDLKPMMADLKSIYRAPTEEDAQYHLEEFAENWDKKYPQVLKSWRENYLVGIRSMLEPFRVPAAHRAFL